MDLDAILGLPRWKILELLSEQGLSPLELSEKLGTSVSYISQQLKLLEVAGLVQKTKTGSAQKGKPRSVYSLNKEILHVSSVYAGGSVKKSILLEEYHKTILRIWNVENQFFHYHLEKLYWKLEDHLENIKGIFYKSMGGKLHIIVVGSNAKLKSYVASLSKQFSSVFKLEFVLESAGKNYAGFSAIYDPEFILQSGKNELKGGTEQ